MNTSLEDNVIFCVVVRLMPQNRHGFSVTDLSAFAGSFPWEQDI